MAQMGKLNAIEEGFGEGLSETAKLAEKLSNSRLIRLFNTLATPLSTATNEYAMPKDATFGRDMGTYLQISDKIPNGNGGTTQTIEIGTGRVFAKNLLKGDIGVEPGPDNVKFVIERSADGETKLSAYVKGNRVEGFDKVDPKVAGKTIGQLAGRVQLGQMVSTGEIATRITGAAAYAQSMTMDPSQQKRGVFKVADIQAALKARQGATNG